ncbi:MAG: recombination protein RecR [Bacteroidetes bacterium GWE2_29_8]|nr:MAG: recombination protein RecR [Bacteroidetes bacterium GWE2_29_8]OFY18615.1 MAG: recombination protein RecR [Bacteroidetes bacterium GWF2_29_10]
MRNLLYTKTLDEAINEFSKLPGIGKRTAVRHVLYLLKQKKDDIIKLSEAIYNLHKDIIYCEQCHNISDTETCPICSDQTRDKKTICIVEDIRDIIAVENTQQYKGLYHVLGGVISPIDGIGPSDLNINSLNERIIKNDIQEIIIALSTTMEGDTTSYYIYKRLSSIENLKISVISRGISIGEELEYTDEITLGRSILNRLPYESIKILK